LANPESETRFLCFPFYIKQKYYPFAIFGLFSLLSMEMFPRLDLLASIMLGYIEYRRFNGMLLRLSSAKLLRIENSFVFKKFSARSDFILANNIGQNVEQ